MVVAMAFLLVASLLVAPAAARGADIRDIMPGDTIFVWEENLDLSALGNPTTLNRYADDDPTKALIHEIPVSNAASFDVLASLVEGEYGVYYAMPSGDQIRIREPTLQTDVVLDGDRTASIDGDTIARSTQIAFKIDSGSVGALYKNANDDQRATVKVELTTPAGGKTTTFGGQPLTGIELNAAEVVEGAIDPSNEAAGTYSAVVKWDTVPTGFDNYASSSNTVSFTLTTKVVDITSNVDTVVRNNNFVVTITGESQKDYWVYIQSPSATVAENPQFRPDQPGVDDSAAARATIAAGSPTNFRDVAGTAAIVRTNAGGTRTAEFETDQNVDAKTYTIRVVDPTDQSRYDTVKVRVEEGDITVTADGDRRYYLGEEITFSGTNTDSDEVFIFVTGPNLARDGVLPTDTSTATVSGWPWTFITVDVEADDTWEWKFDTQQFDVDAGTYTFYALTDAFDRSDLSETKYDTVSVVVRQGFLSSSASQSTVAKGDSLFIRGTAQGNPDEVAIWIIGTNHFARDTATVEDDASFEYELTSDATQDLAAGQYFVVVQHPMRDGDFNVIRDVDDPTGVIDLNRVGILGTTGRGTDGFIYTGRDRLQGSSAAQALIDLLNNQNVDDTYNRLTFLVQEPWIRVDAISDKYVGTTFTLTGTTNLGVDHELLIDVRSSAFEPTDKTAAGEFYGDAGTVKVVEGDEGYNTWSFEIDATAFKPDEYIVIVESISADTTTTANFNVLEGVPATPTPEPVDPTPTPEPVEPTPVPPTPEPTPGFGALVAIAGLGAVAFLVLRRD